MSKLFTTLAVQMLVIAGSALAQDYRSPDARQAVVMQDLRSPDASQPAAPQDFRSPDAISPWMAASAPTAAPATGSSFDWESLAILVAIALTVGGTYIVTRRRGRDTVALGS